METKETIGTTSRTIQLIRLLAESTTDLTAKAVTEGMNLPPSTVHRLLQILTKEGIVDRAPQRRYRIGSELYRIAALVNEQASLPAQAKPFLQRVMETLDETALFSLYRSHDKLMAFVARADSPKPLRYRINMNRPLPVVWGASGKAIVAFLPPAEIDAVLAVAGPSPVTGKQLPPRREYEAELEEIRRTGRAVTRHEKHHSAVGIAAPVFSVGGGVIGSLSITIPELRYDARRENEFVETVKAAAQALSAIIGQRK